MSKNKFEGLLESVDSSGRVGELGGQNAHAFVVELLDEQIAHGLVGFEIAHLGRYLADNFVVAVLASVIRCAHRYVRTLYNLK